MHARSAARAAPPVDLRPASAPRSGAGSAGSDDADPGRVSLERHESSGAFTLTKEAGAHPDVAPAPRLATAAHDAAMDDDADALRDALDAAPLSITARDHTGRSPLHVAAAHDAVACIRVLLQRGANKKLVDDNEETAVEVARGLDCVAAAAALDPRGPEAEAARRAAATASAGAPLAAAIVASDESRRIAEARLAMAVAAVREREDAVSAREQAAAALAEAADRDRKAAETAAAAAARDVAAAQSAAAAARERDATIESLKREQAAARAAQAAAARDRDAVAAARAAALEAQQAVSLERQELEAERLRLATERARPPPPPPLPSRWLLPMPPPRAGTIGDAASRGDAAAVRALLASGAHVDDRGDVSTAHWQNSGVCCQDA